MHNDAPQEMAGEKSGAGAASLANWSVALGFVSLFGGMFFAGIPAIVLGVKALRRMRSSPGPSRGHGLAVVGIVAGAIGTVLITGIVVKVVGWAMLSGGVGRTGGPSVGRMYGEEVSRREFERQQRACSMMYFLWRGEMVDRGRMGEMLRTGTWQRLVLLHNVETRKISATEEEGMEFVRKHPVFQKENQFDGESFIRFLNSMEVRMGLTEKELIAIAREQVAINKLMERVADDAKAGPEQREKALGAWIEAEVGKAQIEWGGTGGSNR